MNSRLNILLVLAFQLFLLQGVFAQSQIKGKLIDSKGNPLAGVSVVLKGTSNGVATDLGGKFSINTAKENDVLVFSYLGYKTKELLAYQNMVVKMESDTQGLEEVVMIGYKSVSKRDLIGSAASVSVDKEIASIPTTNLSSALAGRIAGVNIAQSGGKPGSSSSINIRGATVGNFVGSVSPLYVIDNIISNKTLFDSLDPSEVESVTVLKDAAASAVYGSRAANGVIVVSTRSGKEGKTRVNITSTIGSMSFAKEPETMTPYESALLINSSLDLNEIAKSDTRRITSNELEYLKGVNYGSFVDQNKQNPLINRNSINLSGGTKKIQYALSGSFVTQEGIFKNLNYQKTNLRANVTAKVIEKLSIGLNLSTYNDKRDEFYWHYNGSDENFSDFYQASIIQGKWGPSIIDGKGVLNNVPIWNGSSLINYGQGRKDRNSGTVNARINIDYEIADGLKASLIYNQRKYRFNQKLFRKPWVNYTFAIDPDNRFKFNQNDPNPSPVTRLDGGADANSVSRVYSETQSYQLDAKLQYHKSFAEKHNLGALFVYEQYEASSNYLYGRRRNIATELIPQINGGSSTPEDQFSGGGASENGRLSYIGSIDYNYKNKYYIASSFRYDGSPQFNKSKRFGFFPSLSTGWIVSSEPFMESINFLNFLKIRYSIGETGDDSVGSGFPYRQFYNVGGNGNAIFGVDNKQSVAVSPGRIPDKNITWSTQTSQDLGVDFELFKGRISSNIDFFFNQKRGLYGTRQIFIPSSSGINLQPSNYGGIDTKGFDVILAYKDNIGSLSYKLGLNFGYSRSIYKNIEQPYTTRPYEILNGHLVDRMFGYESLGILRTQKQVDDLIAKGYKINNHDPVLGDLYYKDVRGNFTEDPKGNTPDGVIDGNDRSYLAGVRTSQPVNYGVNININYKNFALDVFMQGFAGASKYFNNAAFRPSGFGATSWSFWKDSYTLTNKNAKYPRNSVRGGIPWWKRASNRTDFPYFLQKANYLRLKNINLSYSLPKNWVQKMKVANLKLFVNGTNLFLIYSSIKEFDPETSGGGIPLTKSYSAGINLTF